MSDNTQTMETVGTVKRGVGRPVTKKTLKRVVLLDGSPVGRGRPAKEGKGNRTVVWIPVDEQFDAKKHGTGSKFMPGLNQFRMSIKRVDIKKWEKLAHETVS